MRRVVPVLALLPLAGCPLFSVGAKVQEMCVTLQDRTIKGVPAGEPFRDSSLIDPLESFGAFFELNGTITSAHATLRVRQGATDLKFLESVRVSIRGVEPGSEMPPASLVRCTDFSCASESDTAELETDVPEDVVDYVRAGMVQLDLTMTGALPRTDWKVDLEVCLSGEASVELSL